MQPCKQTPEFASQSVPEQFSEQCSEHVGPIKVLLQPKMQIPELSQDDELLPGSLQFSPQEPLQSGPHLFMTQPCLQVLFWWQVPRKQLLLQGSTHLKD